jgi:hypothetical protein
VGECLDLSGSNPPTPIQTLPCRLIGKPKPPSECAFDIAVESAQTRTTPPEPMRAYAYSCLLALGCLSLTAALGAESQREKTTRLGFVFDPKIREAALAAEQQRARSIFEATPADADVVRLPNYTVTDGRIPLEEHELLTPKGKVDVAMKRYVSPLYRKTLGPLSAVASFLNNPLGGWAPNTPEAMSLYADDENKRRRARVAELEDLATLAEELTRIKRVRPAGEKK